MPLLCLHHCDDSCKLIVNSNCPGIGRDKDLKVPTSLTTILLNWRSMDKMLQLITLSETIFILKKSIQLHLFLEIVLNIHLASCLVYLCCILTYSYRFKLVRQWRHNQGLLDQRPLTSLGKASLYS